MHSRACCRRYAKGLLCTFEPHRDQPTSATQVGLLPRSNGAQVSFAYDMYAHTATNAKADDFDDQVALVETFKRTFCREVRVEFLGVW